ncbi:unnamed protein product [Candidula unifasciata]|uniref:Nucleoporin NUP42 n=1 Tax=Candidula unifasciata TaxID=100452 RepID=A0A8S3ZBC5_9EUPU|nr:unnamed protein product [Candidula unifasciata]
MSVPVCRFYQSQTCRFGKNCRYLHPSSQRPPPQLELKQDPDGSLTYDPTNSVAALTLYDHHSSDQHEDTLSQRTAREAQSSQDSQGTAPEKHGVHPINANRPVNRNICHYFQTYGNCRHGNECRFLHVLSNRHEGYSHGSSRRQGGLRNVAEIPPRFRKNGEELVASKRAATVEVVAEDVKTQEHTHDTGRPHREWGRASQDTEVRVCPYFRRGHCNRGEYCRFVHSHDHVEEEKFASTNHEFNKTQTDGKHSTNPRRVSITISDVRAQPQNTRKTISSSIIRPVIIKQKFTYAELDNIDLVKVRDSEISTIKKRFPRDKINIIEETQDKFCARILFSPTDPDWAFDVRVFELLLVIPPDYPKQMMKVQLPKDQKLPETVRRYIEVSIEEWLRQKMEQQAADRMVELLFRPFLLWLDRNIEDITMEALKQFKRELVAQAAGMEFIPAHKLQARLRSHSEHLSEDDARSDEDSDDLTGSDSDSSHDDDDDDSSGEYDDTGMIPKLNIDPEKKGTEIELRQLQLRENASALLFERLKLVLQCGRCKNHSDITVAPGKVMSTQCEKCSQNQFVHFRAALIHQFSSVAGYLDLDGCQAFDLIFQDCRVAVTCLSCSKQTRLDGLVSGHMVDGWCQACNARFKLATEAVKFVQLAPSTVDTAAGRVVEVGTSRQKKAAKDPAIREGYPLPEFGTCKHYKHSYRWLRFPCCGKAYPCDVCHDKKEDHEMVYATRMICGHCCREQNFSASRPCSACGQHLTKIRTAHWEGGSGCRDKVSMSKSDQQKYKNMNKTLSNRQKQRQATTQKKVTKLRHA